MRNVRYSKASGSAGADLPDEDLDLLRLICLVLDITHRCPFNCSGCIERVAMSCSHHSQLTLSTILDIVKRFARQGGHELWLYGGEPTAHDCLDEVIQYAADCMDLIRVVTNGAFLTRFHEAILSAAEVTNVSVRTSLNAGTAATHELIHQVRGYFPKVIEGMKLLSSGSKDTKLHLGISFLVEEANCREVLQAYEVASEVGVQDFWVRAKTGTCSIGLEYMSPAARKAVLEAVYSIQRDKGATPVIHIAPWFLEFLETNRSPDISKPYPVCYYCASSRVVVTPDAEHEAVAWSCTYHRSDRRFFVANLDQVPLGSREFDLRRFSAMLRVAPFIDCREVICDRDGFNRAVWSRIESEKGFTSMLSITGK